MAHRWGLSRRCLSSKKVDMRCPGSRCREEMGWGDTSPADGEKLQKTLSRRSTVVFSISLTLVFLAQKNQSQGVYQVSGFKTNDGRLTEQ